MLVSHYDYCNKNIGKMVKINDNTGKTYIGKIMKVDKEKVYIKELRTKDLGGYGYGFGGGFGRGFFNPFCNAFFNPLIFTSFLTPLFFNNIIGCNPFRPFI